MNKFRLFLVSLVCMLSVAAHAQWQWIDKDGRKVFSDRAPPADVLEKNILKRPGQRAGKVQAEDDLSTSAPPTPAPSGAKAAEGATSPQLSGVDKALADKKKQAEQAQEAKRKAEEEKLLQAKAENCARAKQAKASYDSGMRLARINEKGEREVLDDAARASETKRIQSVIDQDCR